MARIIKDSFELIERSIQDITTSLINKDISVTSLKVSDIAEKIRRIRVFSQGQLCTGNTFNSKVKKMTGWSSVTKVVFTKNEPSSTSITDLSKDGDESVVAWIESDTLYISAHGTKIASTDCSSMFSGFSNVTSIDVRLLDTTECKYMDKMFYQCEGVSCLDVDDFDISNVTTAADMFSYCYSLCYIYCNQDWSTNSKIKSERMFYSSSALPNYSSSKNTGTYAKPFSVGGLFTPTA